MSIRELIIEQIELERDNQDTQYGGDIHDDTHSGQDWVCLVTRYATDALPMPTCVEVRSREEYVRFRKRMIQSAALAAAAAEWAERMLRLLPEEIEREAS